MVVDEVVVGKKLRFEWRFSSSGVAEPDLSADSAAVKVAENGDKVALLLLMTLLMSLRSLLFG